MHGKLSAIHHDGNGVFKDLSKPFTDASFGVDWELRHQGQVVHRPNHGLAHTLRTAAYAPLIARLYIQHNGLSGAAAQEIVDNLGWVQMALLFYVVGRENDQ